MITRKKFDNAYEQGRSKTIHFLLSKGFPAQAAEEAAQAAWARGWERRGQLRQPDRAVPWVNTIALNMARSGMRKQSETIEFEEHITDPDNVLASVDAEKMLSDCPERYRILLEKRYLEGWGIDDLAEENGCTRRAIRVRLFRARKHIRERYPQPQDWKQIPVPKGPPQ